jgi:Ran GTPase-activating protein (RanGAP) involved in mRNA processing and transport
VNNIGGYSTSTETNPIADIGVLADALAVNRTLAKLVLRANTVSEYAAARLAQGLANNHTISYLSLDWNPLGSTGLSALLNALLEKKRLQVLHVCSCKLTLNSSLPLATAIRTWPALEELALSDNYLGVNGMAAIASAVTSCLNFRTLKYGPNWFHTSLLRWRVTSRSLHLPVTQARALPLLGEYADQNHDAEAAGSTAELLSKHTTPGPRR